MANMVYHVDGMGATDSFAAQAIKSIEQAHTTGAANSGVTSPVAGSTFNPEGNVNVQGSAAGVGNAAASGDQVLFTYTLPANALDQPGRSICVTAFGTNVNSTSTKTAKIKFNGTAVATVSIGASTAGPWQAQVDIMKVGAAGSNTQVAQGQTILGSTHQGVTSTTNLTATESGAITIQLTGSSSTSTGSDVTANFFQVNFMN